MLMKNEYKVRPLSELCDIIEDYADIQDFLRTGYLGEYLIRTPEQLNGENTFYGQVLKISFNPVIHTIRYYDENNECEYKLDIILLKDGFHHLSYSVYDDEYVDEKTEQNMVRILKLQSVKVLQTEEAFFQESTITDFGDVTFEDIKLVLKLFNSLIVSLKDKFDDNIGSIIVPKES